jgi:hypothetical protein
VKWRKEKTAGREREDRPAHGSQVEKLSVLAGSIGKSWIPKNILVTDICVHHS